MPAVQWHVWRNTLFTSMTKLRQHSAPTLFINVINLLFLFAPKSFFARFRLSCPYCVCHFRFDNRLMIIRQHCMCVWWNGCRGISMIIFMQQKLRNYFGTKTMLFIMSINILDVQKVFASLSYICFTTVTLGEYSKHVFV
jgi:hypothetical protein